MTLTVADARHQRSWVLLAIAGCAMVLLFTLTRYVLYAHTFPLVHDAAILHYVSFMIGRGHAPYLQQIEMNLPGVLMTEWFSMRLFGATAVGLWRWDTFVGLCTVAMSVSIAGRGFRWAGACAALLTWIIHLHDGAYDLGEREWLVSMLLMGCAGCTALCLERHQAIWMMPCLALGGWASAIKPIAVLLPSVAIAAVCLGVLRDGAWQLKRRTAAKQKAFLLRVLTSAVVGGLVPLLATVLYFHHWPGSFAAFVQTEHTLGVWYAGQARASLRYMLLGVVSYPMLLVLGLALYLAIRGQFWRDLRVTLLFSGAVVGFVMYMAQWKGFPYHVYPLLLFGLVLGFVLAQRSLASLVWDQRLVALVFLLLAGIRVPLRLWHHHAEHEYPIDTQAALIDDLQHLGGSSLNGSVQCLDMTLGGCMGALYALQLEQPTGFVNDNMLFPTQPQPFLRILQQRFLQEIEARPPRVIVLTAHNWPDQQDRSFSKLNRWPDFAMWLRARYKLQSSHIATTLQHTADYRIYVLR